MKRTRTSSFGSSKREGHDSSPFYSRKLYQSLKIDENQLETENPIPSEILDKVLCQDARRMNNIPDSSVHLMVTSPPYNVGKEYDEDLDLGAYLGLLRQVFSETYRVLVLGGRSCVNVANVGRKPYIPYHKFVIDAMLDAGFLMRGEIIWDKGAGAGGSTAWGSWCSPSNPTLRDTHEYILIFSKGKFSRDSKNKESTIAGDEFLEYTKSVWEFQPESAQRVGHPAPFPIELPYRCIQLYTFKDEVVLDPFCGVGSSCVAAIKSGRHFIGIDINPDYVERAKIRINEYLAQTSMATYLPKEEAPSQASRRLSAVGVYAEASSKDGMTSKRLTKSEVRRHFIAVPRRFMRGLQLSTNTPVKVRVAGKVFGARIDAQSRIWAALFRDYVRWEEGKIMFLNKLKDGSIRISQ